MCYFTHAISSSNTCRLKIRAYSSLVKNVVPNDLLYQLSTLFPGQDLSLGFWVGAGPEAKGEVVRTRLLYCENCCLFYQYHYTVNFGDEK